METTDFYNLIVDVLGALLVPVVLFILGQWFLRSKEKNDRIIQEADQLKAFLEHLSSDDKEKRKLALLALAHMRNADLFPEALLRTVESIAARDDPEVAAVARLASGDARPKDGLSSESRALVLELLFPMKIHFDRSRRTFYLWVKNSQKKPNLLLEDEIKASNSAILNLLTTKWYLVPDDLQESALMLIEHYQTWMDEYDQVRPDGIRDPSKTFVFAGTRGVPFPGEAAKNFQDRYAKMVVESVQLLPGDIFLTRGKSLLSRAIRRFTRVFGEKRTEVNHVGLIVTEGDLRDAMAVEALITVKKHNLWKQYGTSKQNKVAIYRLKNLSDKEREKIASTAKEYVGKKYGFFKLLAHLADWLLLGAYIFRRLAQKYDYPICSWVTAYAYDEVGKSFGVFPNAASPDDIWDHIKENKDMYTEVYPLGYLSLTGND